jgi:hypothetical protein
MSREEEDRRRRWNWAMAALPTGVLVVLAAIVVAIEFDALIVGLIAIAVVAAIAMYIYETFLS